MHINTAKVFAKANRTAMNIHSVQVALDEIQVYMIQ
jgi:hypothetical protein